MDEIKSALAEADPGQYREIVFCGYGEPTERLDILLECAHFLKKGHKLPLRLNTNGLSDLINGKKTAPLLAECLDCVSISLNAADAESYNAICAPSFGEGSFEAMLQFAKDCRAFPSLKTVLSVVAHAIDGETLAKCRALCDSMDIPLRQR
jgi:TatD family-associated radical SAM protein